MPPIFIYSLPRTIEVLNSDDIATFQSEMGLLENDIDQTIYSLNDFDDEIEREESEKEKSSSKHDEYIRFSKNAPLSDRVSGKYPVAGDPDLENAKFDQDLVDENVERQHGGTGDELVDQMDELFHPNPTGDPQFMSHEEFDVCSLTFSLVLIDRGGGGRRILMSCTPLIFQSSWSIFTRR